MDVLIDVLIVVLLLAAWFGAVVGLAKSEARRVSRARLSREASRDEEGRLDERDRAGVGGGATRA